MYVHTYVITGGQKVILCMYVICSCLWPGQASTNVCASTKVWASLCVYVTHELKNVSMSHIAIHTVTHTATHTATHTVAHTITHTATCTATRTATRTASYTAHI